jgi:integrase
VLDYATARHWREGPNPARWKGHLDSLLPARGKVQAVRHHAALPWQKMPAAMARLSSSNGTAAKCVAFAILTAARSSEARGATWAEIADLDGAAVWTVPSGRMKGDREHRVPLAPEAVAILRAMLPLRGKADLVFPGGVTGRPLSDVSLSKAWHLAAGGKTVTVHGCRSTFRDFCGEAISVPREVAEKALAHANKDKVEAAYARSDLFDKRRELMNGWSDHCYSAASADARRAS